MTYQAKRADTVYLKTNWNDSDRDIVIECHRQWIARNAKVQPCMSNSPDGRHAVPKGERMLVQKALVEGHWGGYRLCLECCDKWLDEIS